MEPLASLTTLSSSNLNSRCRDLEGLVLHHVCGVLI